MKVLYIKASEKPKGESTSHRLAQIFMEEYIKNNPKDEITEIELHTKNYPYINQKILLESHQNKGPMVEVATEFLSYDKYIVSSPMWNLSVPAILKGYIDLITVKGITFRYNKFGIPVGLVKGKKAFYFGSRGGGYPFPLSLIAFDLKYIKCIFKFLGVKKFKSFILENVDKSAQKTEEKFEKSIEKIKKLARKF